MTGQVIKLGNFRLTKDGKLKKITIPRNASHKIAMKKSKRVRVAKKGSLP